MMKRCLAIAVPFILLAGCGGGHDTEKASDEVPLRAQAARYSSELPMNELMAHVMQYSADGIWSHQGVIIDRDGEHSLFPENDDEWEEAESASLTLAELTNILLLPERRMDGKEWDQTVDGVRTVALSAAKAAEKHDVAAFHAAGAALDAACEACHQIYSPGGQAGNRLPSSKSGGPADGRTAV
jgi:hypothetical protein